MSKVVDMNTRTSIMTPKDVLEALSDKLWNAKAVAIVIHDHGDMAEVIYSRQSIQALNLMSAQLAVVAARKVAETVPDE